MNEEEEVADALRMLKACSGANLEEVHRSDEKTNEMEKENRLHRTNYESTCEENPRNGACCLSQRIKQSSKKSSPTRKKKGSTRKRKVGDRPKSEKQQLDDAIVGTGHALLGPLVAFVLSADSSEQCSQVAFEILRRFSYP